MLTRLMGQEMRIWYDRLVWRLLAHRIIRDA